MELSEIATLAGKSGLFRVLKPTRTGVILESLDEKKTKIVAGTQHRVSVLEEICHGSVFKGEGTESGSCNCTTDFPCSLKLGVRSTHVTTHDEGGVT